MQTETYQRWRLPIIGNAEPKKILVEAQQKNAEQATLLEDLKLQARKEGMAAARHEIDNTLSELHELRAVLEKPLEIIDKKCEELLLNLVVMLTQQCLQREISLDKTLIEKSIEHCLTHLKSNEAAAELTVSAEISDLYEKYLKTTTVSTLKLLSDPNLTPGEYLFKSSQIEIEARVMNTLSKSAQAILQHE